MVSEYQSNLGLEHWTDVKYIFKYLTEMRDSILMCHYDKLVPFEYMD